MRGERRGRGRPGCGASRGRGAARASSPKRADLVVEPEQNSAFGRPQTPPPAVDGGKRRRGERDASTAGSPERHTARSDDGDDAAEHPAASEAGDKTPALRAFVEGETPAAPGGDLLLLLTNSDADQSLASKRRKKARVASGAVPGEGAAGVQRTPLRHALRYLRQLPDFLDPSLFSAATPRFRDAQSPLETARAAGDGDASESEAEERAEGEEDEAEGENEGRRKCRRGASVAPFSVRAQAVEALHARLSAEAAAALVEGRPPLSAPASTHAKPRTGSPSAPTFGKRYQGRFLRSEDAGGGEDDLARRDGGEQPEQRCRRALLRLIRREAIPLLLKRPREKGASRGGDTGCEGGCEGGSLEEETRRYALCLVRPLQSVQPSPLSSLARRDDPRGGAGSAAPWRDCFLNAGSSVWTLAVCEELPGGGAACVSAAGADDEGFVVLAVGVHGRAALLSCLGGLGVGEGGGEENGWRPSEEAESALATEGAASGDPGARGGPETRLGAEKSLGMIQLWRVSSDPRRRPRFALGILHSGGSCRSLQWVGASARDLRRPPAAGSAGAETRRQAEIGREATRRPREAARADARADGLAEAAGATIAPSVKTESADGAEGMEGAETREDSTRGASNVEPETRRPGLREDNPEKLLFASRVGLLAGAFADDSLRIWSVPLAPFVDPESDEEAEDESEDDAKGLSGVCRETTETLFARRAARCFFLPPVWSFRHPDVPRPPSPSMPFFCVAAAPPPLAASAPGSARPAQAPGASAWGLPYEAAPLRLVAGSEGGMLFVFSFFASPCTTGERPQCVWAAAAVVAPSAHLRACAFLPAADSSLLAVSAASGGDDSSSNNSVVLVNLRQVAAGAGSGGAAAEAAPGLLPPIEAKSGCVSGREIHDIAWSPIGRYATVAATNAVVVNLQKPQATQLPLKQVLPALMLASLEPAPKAPRGRPSAAAKARGGRGGGPGAGGAPKLHEEERKQRERAAKDAAAVDRCCWSTSVCGHLGLFVFDDGSFVSGSLSLLEQRVFDSADLVRWTLPGSREQRLVSEHRKLLLEQTGAAPSADGTLRPPSACGASPELEDGLSAPASPPCATSGHTQQGSADNVAGVSASCAPGPEGREDPSFRSLFRHVAARFAAQQTRQVKRLAASGLLVEIFREEEGAARETDAAEPSQAPAASRGSDAWKQAGGVGDAGKTASQPQEASGLQQPQARRDEEGEEEIRWKPEDERILALHRIVSVCPYRNSRYFGQRPLAVYGGAAGIIHLRALC
ncbi:hypothetical protein BESB_030100 [Besnoitia besnoiti]|uniref:Uncharacterized protein n=1 Tax=Besnoitia besnoiti TaxID=94643 RepID=A0A2A9M5G8_BESBE|nr:hypothetical protein BESB_030100 [Besnoitia besnoiti]PFH31136.1 hypothetical protein BESB_030100 [Besnoitia besnoiti]